MPDSKEYKKGIYTNLQAKFGKDNLPDENTFYQKIDSDINYRKGVLTNLETAYGKENVPTFDDFENRLGVKKKNLLLHLLHLANILLHYPKKLALLWVVVKE
jgi:hypothetical protein